jgi:predicted dienelactone hydrolase
MVIGKKNMIFVLILIILFPRFGSGQGFNVGERTLLLTDSARNRMVKTELWYPTNDSDSAGKRKTELAFILDPTIRDAKIYEGKHPLVLLSHGTGGNRFGLAWLAIALVKKGFIVAAPDHWGNTYDNKIPEYFVRSWERPIDLSFLVSYLLSQPGFAEFFNENNIGAAGFSLGGYTVLALAGAEIDYDLLKRNAKTKEGRREFTIPEYGVLTKLIEKISFGNPGVAAPVLDDPRIKCFVAISPALGLGFSNSGQMEKIKSPVLIIGTGNDQIAPVATNA